VSERGLAGTCAPATTQPLGRVNPASKLDGNIYSDGDGAVCDVMLDLVDISKNSDEYYVLKVCHSCICYLRLKLVTALTCLRCVTPLCLFFLHASFGTTSSRLLAVSAVLTMCQACSW
jgi:hypothetical protein